MTAKITDDLLAGKFRDVEKARARVAERIDAFFDAVSLAVQEKRITPKEAAAIRAGLKGE